MTVAGKSIVLNSPSAGKSVSNNAGCLGITHCRPRPDRNRVTLTCTHCELPREPDRRVLSRPFLRLAESFDRPTGYLSRRKRLNLNQPTHKKTVSL